MGNTTTVDYRNISIEVKKIVLKIRKIQNVLLPMIWKRNYQEQTQQSF